MFFRDVIGHYSEKAGLIRQFRDGMLPHAMMFAGPAGNGKLPLAIALAAYIHCENRTDEDACGSCGSCVKMAKFSHPDLHFSFPVISKKSVKDSNVSSYWLSDWRKALSEDPYMYYQDWMARIADEGKQGNISRNEAAQIIQKLSLRTYESKYKVMIIWMAEYLKEEGNHLLKLLEEPPEGTFLILIADRPSEVIGTILSRCQMVRVGMIESDAITEALVKSFEIGEEDAASIANLAEGDYRAAQMLVGDERLDLTKEFLEWMRLCYKIDPSPLVNWIEKLAQKGREAQKNFLQGAAFLLREALHFQYNPTHLSRLTQEEVDALMKFSKFLKFHQLAKLQQQMEQDSYYIVRNGNPRLIFMTGSLNAHRVLMDRQ